MIRLDCPDCRRHLAENGWAVLHACASVGIGRGADTRRLAALYMDGYHRKGHRS